MLSKKNLKHFFDPENIKQQLQKLLTIGSQLFLYLLAWLPKQPRNRNPLPPKAP